MKIIISVLAGVAALSFSANYTDLSKYIFDKPAFVYELDMGLNEISGLAVNDEGRLFANNDEIGSVFELDPNNGKIVKWFWLGPNRIYEDFEAVALNGKDFYLITSNCLLYKFYAQPDGKYSQYEKIRTGITGSYEIEGMCYDPKTNSLLLASKKFAGKENNNYRAVLSYNLKSGKLSDKPRFLINLNELKKKYNIKDFSPSDIEYDKSSGNFLVLSSNDKGILEISSGGRILNYTELKKNDHRQPEGLTILKDNTLLIGDEGSGKKPTLTGYRTK